jgi:putative endopeptidase
MLNGKLTLGENTADNGGLRIAYMALLDTLAAQGKSIDDKIDGYTEAQRYFISFGQVWCENRTEQSARQPRSLTPIRPAAGAPMAQCATSTHSARPSDVQKGQPMYPANSCRVW